MPIIVNQIDMRFRAQQTLPLTAQMMLFSDVFGIFEFLINNYLVSVFDHPRQ